MLFSDLMRYVEQEYRIAVSLEVCHPVFFHREELKLAPDQYLHHIKFCRAVKLHDGHRVCIRNKDRSILIARHGRCFCGKCPFGILEYAAPILYEKQLAAVLYLGGFVDPGWQPPDFYHDEMPLPAGEKQREELRNHALFLKKNLEIELHTIGKTGGMNIIKRHDDKFYIRNALAFIDGHYQENISLADLADMLRVNPNYLGSVIQKKLHATFREKLTEKRLREAEILLRLHNWLSIGEIAFKCGFSDSNYFSARFHRKLGMTPTEYRKKQQSAK